MYIALWPRQCFCTAVWTGTMAAAPGDDIQQQLATQSARIPQRHIEGSLVEKVKLPDPGESAALVEMRTMCPGKPATLEDIEEACRETPFRTPFWKDNTSQTDIPERLLSPAEVDVINKKYLELEAAFDAK